MVHLLIHDLSWFNNFKPLIISPLNLVPRPNGAPRLIDDLSRFNKFVSRGPKVKHQNVFNLSQLNMCYLKISKLDLCNRYFHIPIYPPHRTYLGFSFEKQYIVLLWVFSCPRLLSGFYDKCVSGFTISGATLRFSHIF